MRTYLLIKTFYNSVVPCFVYIGVVLVPNLGAAENLLLPSGPPVPPVTNQAHSAEHRSRSQSGHLAQHCDQLQAQIDALQQRFLTLAQQYEEERRLRVQAESRLLESEMLLSNQKAYTSSLQQALDSTQVRQHQFTVGQATSMVDVGATVDPVTFAFYAKCVLCIHCWWSCLSYSLWPCLLYLPLYLTAPFFPG